MKIVYVNDNDLAGRRFNGHDLQIMLNKRGYEAKQLVISKSSDDINTVSMIKSPAGYYVRDKCKELEDNLSLQSLIYPFGEILAQMPEFQEADIVHYHLLFNHFMSLYSFKKLTRMKPTVWTLHDPWALTGHCVHPVDCKGWLTGCHNCPHLDRYSPLKEDNSNSIWNIKKKIYSEIDIDIVVASPWMLDMVKRSPLTSHFKNVHLIPFGIDLQLFKRRNNRKEVRRKLRIPENNFVLMFRQDAQEWKGLPYIEEMLEKLKNKKPVTILTVGRTGLIDKFKEKFQVIEYDWVDDNDLMVDLYSSADAFLMPSIAESFGLMAVEAMACSLPVIVFDGTALPSVTFAPKCGISLKKGDSEQFVKTVEKLINTPEECSKRGILGRQLTEENYDVEKYNERMIDLYKEIINRKQRNK